MSRVGVVIFVLSTVAMLPSAASAADLKITDSRGTQVVVTGASIDYGGFMSIDLERDGLRVLQGDGAVTVKWTDIDSVRVTKTDTSVKPPRVELEIALKNGKKLPADLFRQGKMKLLGKSELGDYAIDLDKVRSMTPVR
jgi:autotransporter translocation and assembly factor TamB